MDEQNQEDLQNKPLPQPTRRQRFVAWRKRYVRPIWCVRMALLGIGSAVDLQDAISLLGIVLLAVGAERVCGNGYGMLVAGVVLLWPMLIAVTFSRKGSRP